MEVNIEKMQSLTGRIKEFRIDKTLTKKGMCAEAKSTGEELAKKVNISDVADDLISVSSNIPLSANQGRILKNQIVEVQDRFKTDSYSIDTKTFNLPTSKTALIVMSTGENSDLFIATNYDNDNQHVMRLTSNISTFSVSISGNIVTVGNSGYWFKYNAIMI